MPTDNHAGGYAFLEGSHFASGGVVALTGHSIEGAVFARPLPLPQAFQAVERYLAQIGRPLEALCGMEFRMPKVLEVEPFLAFNRVYLAQLRAWGLLPNGVCPLARTNVVPIGSPIQDDVISAFSYTVPTADRTPTFVFSGMPEVPDGKTYPKEIVRRGETNTEALVEKMQCVVHGLISRATALGVTWNDPADVHLYSPHAIAHALKRSVLDAKGFASVHGITWFDTAPPVFELELEIDIRRYSRKAMLP